MFSLLFFDDWYLHRRENLARHVGCAELVPEATFEDPYLDTHWGYPTVFRDPDSGLWRCVYQGKLVRGPQAVPAVAESADGIHWTIPDLTVRVPIAGRVTPHQLLDFSRFMQWSGAYADPSAIGTDQWLKGFVVTRESDGIQLGAPLIASRDGIEWRYVDGARWHAHGADPIAAGFWNPYRRSHVIVGRPVDNDRRIALSETRDWRTFTPFEVALQPDALDSPCAEIYGMPVVPHEHMFVGLVWMFHVDPTIDALHKYNMGKIDCQLAYSYNGWHWQRTVRGSLIPNGEPGTFGAGCAYPNCVVDVGDALRIYSSASKGEHAQMSATPGGHQSALMVHALRKDGYVYLEPEGGTGELTTRLLLWEGGEPTLNVSVPHGDVRVQFTDALGVPIDGYTFADCIPFRADSIAWTPEWRDGRLASALKDRVVRVEVRLANGRLYAIRGPFEVKMAYEARLFTEQGIRTPRRHGF